MVQALTPDGANNAFRERILPWRTISRQYFLNAERLCPSGEYFSVNRIAITDQILWLFVHAASLNQLLCGPGSGCLVGYIEMQDPTTVIAENDEYKEDFEASRRDSKEIE